MAAPKEELKVYTGIGLDFETGDLDCKRGGVTQISAHAVRFDTFETMDKIALYVYPYHQKNLGGVRKKVLKNKREIESEEQQLMAYEDKALTYSGLSMELLYGQGVQLEEVVSKFIAFVKSNTISKAKDTKPVLIGQNITFDIGFLQQIFNYTGNMKEFESILAGKKDFYGNFQPEYIDTLLLGRLAFSNERMPNFKLETLSNKLGIELDDAHDADADVTATVNVAFTLGNRMRYPGGEAQNSIIKPKVKTREHFKI